MVNSHRGYNHIDRLQVGNVIIEDKRVGERDGFWFLSRFVHWNENWRPSATFDGLGSLNAKENETFEPNMLGLRCG